MKCTQKWMVYKGKSIKGSMEWKHLHIWQASNSTMLWPEMTEETGPSLLLKLHQQIHLAG